MKGKTLVAKRFVRRITLSPFAAASLPYVARRLFPALRGSEVVSCDETPATLNMNY